MFRSISLCMGGMVEKFLSSDKMSRIDHTHFGKLMTFSFTGTVGYVALLIFVCSTIHLSTFVIPSFLELLTPNLLRF